MESLDSSGLGSFPLSSELDAEFEHSMENDVENSMHNDESQALAVRKVSFLRAPEQEAAATQSCKHTDAQAKNTHAHISII
jgi:hypothetical protein